MAPDRSPAGLLLPSARHPLAHRLILAHLAFVLVVHVVRCLAVSKCIKHLAEEIGRTNFACGLLTSISGLFDLKEPIVGAVEDSFTSAAHRLHRQLKVEVDVFMNGVFRSADPKQEIKSIHGVDLLNIGEATQVQVWRNKLVELLCSLFTVELTRTGLTLDGEVHAVDDLVVDLQVDIGR